MQLSGRVRRAASVLCASTLVACAGPATGPGQMDLTAACRTAAGGETRIIATLRNATPEHVSVVAGAVLGNDERLAFALSLRVRRAGATALEEYVYSDPRYAAVAGRLAPWRLELAAGATAILVLEARHFLSPTAGRRFDATEPGVVSVRFRGQETGSPWPGLRLSRPWTGVVESGPIRIPDACPAE